MATRFRLQELLEQVGMTQTELHQRSKVAYSRINAIYLNKSRRVDLDTLDALAAVLRCEPCDLITRAKPGR